MTKEQRKKLYFCAWCGTCFEPVSTDRDKRFCSDVCYRSWLMFEREEEPS